MHFLDNGQKIQKENPSLFNHYLKIPKNSNKDKAATKHPFVSHLLLERRERISETKLVWSCLTSTSFIYIICRNIYTSTDREDLALAMEYERIEKVKQVINSSLSLSLSSTTSITLQWVSSVEEFLGGRYELFLY